MKTKIFLTTCALAAAFVGCQNDEFDTIGGGEQASAGLVEVGDNFMIVGVGEEPADTRTHWVENTDKTLTSYFSPIVAKTGEGNTEIDAVEVMSPTIGACALVGGSVHSNYEFYHYGWLGKGQTEATFDPCDPSRLTNGWSYSELTYKGTAPSYNEDKVTDAALDTKNVWLFTDASKIVGNTTLKVSEMNANSGIYKTENKAMFEGDYILYYPYDESFSSGLIPARSKVAFTGMTRNNISDPQVAENTFRYAYAEGLVGGTEASAFEFTSLSGIIKITVNGNFTSDIKKLMLYSPSGAFKKTVYLNPSSIVSGQNGTSVYANNGEEETSKTIVIEMANGNNLEGVKNDTDKPGAVYVAALPTNVPDLKVLAYNTKNQWATYEIGAKEIKPNTGVGVEVTFSDKDFKNVYLAIDAATMKEAITNSATVATQQTPATIQVIGDITLDKANATDPAENKYEIPPYVTVTGDKIVVPEGVRLDIEDNATIESDVDIEGEACCTTLAVGAGEMWVLRGGTIAGDVNVKAGNGEGKEAATLWFAAGKSNNTSVVAKDAVITVDGNVTFKGVTDVFGTLTIGENAKATVGDVNGGASPNVNVKGGIVNNNGEFEVLYGRFAVLDASGQTVAAAGKNFKNNGKFIDNVGTTVTGAIQSMTMGAEAQYICKVNSQARLNEAYQSKTAANVIDIIEGLTGTAPEYKDDAYNFDAVKQHADKDVDIVVSGTGVKFLPNKAVTIGNLSVAGAGELTVEKTETYKVGTGTNIQELLATLTVNGDIELYGDFKTANDVIGMTADNLTVFGGGAATFGNRTNTTDVTVAIDNTIDVQKNGSFTITPAGSGLNVAYITCRKLIEGGTINGAPTVIE